MSILFCFYLRHEQYRMLWALVSDETSAILTWTLALTACFCIFVSMTKQYGRTSQSYLNCVSCSGGQRPPTGTQLNKGHVSWSSSNLKQTGTTWQPCHPGALQLKRENSDFPWAAIKALLPAKCKGLTIRCTCRGWGTWPDPSPQPRDPFNIIQLSSVHYKTFNRSEQCFSSNLNLAP